jgi:hypothetical protein
MIMLKKMFFLFVALFLSPLTAYAGGACTHQSTKAASHGGETRYWILLQCTADSGDASMSAQIPATAMAQMSGKFIYRVITYPGSTPPTDSSDVAITATVATGKAIDLITADGNGLDKIDSTTVESMYTEGPYGGDHYYLVNEDYPMSITQSNNSVNSAIVNYLMILVP